MAKYIDPDFLRKEIEKRLKNVRDYMSGTGMRYKGPKYFKAQGKESAYDALLSIVNSLQQEQPEIDSEKSVPNDLEEAAKKYAKAYTDNDNGNGGDDWEDDIKLTFIAGAKWQADHTPLPEDTVLFNKGVEEGKRLMMEEAVSVIESRFSEIIGDAQPKPALRAELEELIKRIKDGK